MTSNPSRRTGPDHYSGPVVGFIVRWSRRAAGALALIDVAVVLSVLLAVPVGIVLWAFGWIPSSGTTAMLIVGALAWLILLSLLLRSVLRGVRPPRT